MIDTGLEVTVDASRAKAGAAEFNAAMNSMGAAAETNLSRMRGAINGITGSIFNFRNVLLGIGLTGLVRELVQTQLWFNQTTIALEAATGSASGAAYEYDFLTRTVRTLGLDLKAAGTQFAFIEAAARGTGFAGKEAEHVFLGFSTAISGLHLPAERAALILGAVQRMISTNTVNARELRLQLAMSLPGAMQIAAEATGKTQAQLNQMMRSGKLFAQDILPQMADALIKRYGHAAEQAANSTQGLINRFNSAKTQFQLNILKGGLGVGIDSGLKQMVEALEDPKLQEAAFTLGHVLGEGVKLAAAAFSFLTQHVWLTIGAFGALVTLQIAATIMGIVESVLKLKDAIMALTIAEKLSALFSASPAKAFAGIGAGPLGGSILQASRGAQGAVTATTAVSAATSAAGATGAVTAMAAEATAAGKLSAEIKDLGAAKGKLAYFQRSAILASQESKAALAAELPLFTTLAPSVATSAKQMELFALEQTAVKKAAVATTEKIVAEGVATGGIAAGFQKIAAAKAPSIFGSIGTAASATIPRLLAASAAIPVWGQLLLVIAGIAAGLYAARDATIEFDRSQLTPRGVKHDSEVFQLKDIYRAFIDGLQDRWNEFVDNWKLNLQDIKAFWEGLFNHFEWLDKLGAAIEEKVDIPFSNWVKSHFDKIFNSANSEVMRRFRRGKAENAAEAAGKTGGAGTPGPDGKFGPEDAGKSQVDRVQELLDKQRIQIDTMKQLISLNQQYAFSQEAGDIAIAKATALRKADEEVLRLHGKATAAQIQQIRDNEVALAMLEIRERSLQNLRKSNIDTMQQIRDQKQLNQATLEGEAAVNRVTMAIEVQNKVRALGIGLSAREKAEAANHIAELEAEKLKKSYEDQAKALKAQLNPEYAREQAVAHLNELMKVGVLTQEEATRAIKDYDRAFDESINSRLEKSQKWEDGLLLGMRRIQMDSQDVAKNVAQAFTDAFTQMEDAFTSFLDTGKFDLASLEKSILHTINSAVVKNVFGGGLGKILGNEGTGNPDEGGSWFGKLLGISGVFGKGRQTPTGTKDNPFYVRMDSFGSGTIGAPADGGFSDIIGQIQDMTMKGVQDQNQIWSEEIPKVTGAWEEQAPLVGSYWQKVASSMLGGGSGGAGGGGFFNLLFGSEQGDGGGILGSLFGAGGDSASGGGGMDWGGFDAPVFAMGGIMTSHGKLPLNRYSMGGVARSAQLAMFGEGSNPEAYVPLPDGRNIPVKMEGGGRVIQIEQHLHVHGVKDADSFRRSQSQIMADMARGTSRAMQRNG